MKKLDPVKKMIRASGILDLIPDETYLSLRYRYVFGRWPDLKNPKTFNEKLNWLKLHDRRPIYMTLVDKIAVKNYVAERIGREYVTPTLGVWSDVDDIDFELLPDRFALKTNHGSGDVLLCRNKAVFDFDAARKSLATIQRRGIFPIGREWPYKGVPRMILAEPLLEVQDKDEIEDYKFLFFNGEHRCSFVCSERRSESGLKVTFFDPKWNRLPFERKYPSSSVDVPRPAEHDKMVELGRKLAKGFPFVRIDFYDIDGMIRFGEFTLYPGCGFEPFSPARYDRVLGDWLELPPPIS